MDDTQGGGPVSEAEFSAAMQEFRARDETPPPASPAAPPPAPAASLPASPGVLAEWDIHGDGQKFPVTQADLPMLLHALDTNRTAMEGLASNPLVAAALAGQDPHQLAQQLLAAQRPDLAPFLQNGNVNEVAEQLMYQQMMAEAGPEIAHHQEWMQGVLDHFNADVSTALEEVGLGENEIASGLAASAIIQAVENGERVEPEEIAQRVASFLRQSMPAPGQRPRRISDEEKYRRWINDWANRE